jgi:hypothetical protein
MSNLPPAGPILLTVPGITDTSIAGATTGAAVQFQWPRPYVLSGLWVNVRGASLIELGLLRLRIQDASRDELVTSGQGNLLTMGCASFMGRQGLRWQPFRHEVRAGDRWIFQFTNGNAGAVVPWLGLRVET